MGILPSLESRVDGPYGPLWVHNANGGLEPPTGFPTTPSRWRVCQLHHFGEHRSLCPVAWHCIPETLFKKLQPPQKGFSIQWWTIQRRGGCSDCEVNCALDPAYWIRKERTGGKPTSAFPRLNPTVACYCLLLQPLTRPSQNPVSARDQPTSRLIGIAFAPCFNPSR